MNTNLTLRIINIKKSLSKSPFTFQLLNPLIYIPSLTSNTFPFKRISFQLFAWNSISMHESLFNALNSVSMTKTP